MLRELEREHARVTGGDTGGELRWMLEELRVATFAQPLGPRGRPSEQKIRAALARLQG